MRKRALLLGVSAALAVIGCSSSEPTATNQPPQQAATSGAPAMQQTNVPLAPEQSSATMNVSDADLAKKKTAYEKAKADYTKKPTDEKLKAAYVKATVDYATGTMYANSLDPKQKYPGALRLYREALKVDPSNQDASHNKDMIEGIYKQLGRPIPQ